MSKIKILCLKPAHDMYIHGKGLQNRFDAALDHVITEQDNGNYRVKAFGQEFGIANSSVHFVVYDTTKEPVAKK